MLEILIRDCVLVCAQLIYCNLRLSREECRWYVTLKEWSANTWREIIDVYSFRKKITTIIIIVSLMAKYWRATKPNKEHYLFLEMLDIKK